MFDVYAALNEVVLAPGSYGLTNVTDACFTGYVDGSQLGSVPVSSCANPDEYAFWDYEHPTATIANTLGNMVYASLRQGDAAVPEPSSIALLIAGLFCLAVTAKRRSSSVLPAFWQSATQTAYQVPQKV